MKGHMTTLGFTDDVRGIVIGDFMHRVELISPKGTVNARGSIGASDDPKAWGIRELNRIKAEKCGDGKAIIEHPELFADIYGKGEWEIRIYD